MKQYLTFSTESLHFGLDSAYVREIFPLPALQPLAEAPGDVIGLLNVRGRLTPILHLARRLGMTQPACKLQDSIILLDWQGLQVGLVVDQVHEVQEIDDSLISDTPNLEREGYLHTFLIHGFAQVEDDLLTLLHPESLIRQADDVAMLAWEAELNPEQNRPFVDSSNSSGQNFFSICPSLTDLERQIFERRAKELKNPLDSYDISRLQPITLLSLEGEYFGVALDNVREFIHVPKLTNIPCSPGHIVGNFNLRGEILTLLDLSSALDLNCSTPRSKAVILDIDHQGIGVSVDEVHDVLYLSHEDYLEFPTTISQDHQQFLAGAFEYQGQVVRLIDLPALLTQFYPQAAIAA